MKKIKKAWKTIKKHSFLSGMFVGTVVTLVVVY